MAPSSSTHNRIPLVGDRHAVTVSHEPLAALVNYWRRTESSLAWNCLFVLPMWLDSWWSSFGEGRPPGIITVKHQGEPIGIAPLIIEKHQARFIGAPNVCDYQDMIVEPGKEAEFFGALFGYLKDAGIKYLELNPLHADSTVVTALPGLETRMNCRFTCTQEDWVYAMDLPPSWQAYLGQLSGKQRHEIRRKLRRLHDAADVRLRVVEADDVVADEMDVFIDLFTANRSDKNAFMTQSMGAYFRCLAKSLAEAGLLKLYFLDLDGHPAATAMCFDYGHTIYLYNNGYNRRFQSLSVGVICKVLAIKDAIERKRIRFDFLKGSEKYKQHLGGKPFPVYRCRIDLL